MTPRAAFSGSVGTNGSCRRRCAIEHTEAALNHISGTRGGIVGVYQTYNYEAELKDCYVQWG